MRKNLHCPAFCAALAERNRLIYASTFQDIPFSRLHINHGIIVAFSQILES